jgi:uncharacterized membrane protein
VLAGAAVVVLAGVVLRFTTSSPLWLDEALSVNIARLPLGDIPEALRHDGHPPLYYVLLHAWMAVLGEGDVAVRSLSGLFGLVLLPLVWIAARRLGNSRVAGCALAVAVLSPYALRYSTETRMYSLMMVLALAGWLLLDDAVRRPTTGRLAGLAAVTAALLWTHYWAFWVLGVAGATLVVQLVRARRAGQVEAAASRLRILAALAVGGVAFVPWLPSLAYQSANTGTPWARPVRPTEMITGLIADLGGGPQAEAVLLGWVIVLLAVAGTFGARGPEGGIVLRSRLRPAAAPFVLAVGGTLAVACVVGYATGSTFASRYAAVIVPFIWLLAAIGLSLLSRRPAAIVLVLLLGLGVIGAYRNVTLDRSDAARSAAAIDERAAPGDVVLFCPDQLGPSTSRLLTAEVDAVTYPRLEAPELVDWVDYKARLETTSPAEVAAEVLERAGDGQVFLVYSTSYVTHEEICPSLFNELGAARPPEVLTETTEAWEPSAVVLFAPPAG